MGGLGLFFSVKEHGRNGFGKVTHGIIHNLRVLLGSKRRLLGIFHTGGLGEFGKGFAY